MSEVWKGGRRRVSISLTPWVSVKWKMLPLQLPFSIWGYYVRIFPVHVRTASTQLRAQLRPGSRCLVFFLVYVGINTRHLRRLHPCSAAKGFRLHCVCAATSCCTAGFCIHTLTTLFVFCKLFGTRVCAIKIRDCLLWLSNKFLCVFFGPSWREEKGKEAGEEKGI